MSSVTSHAVEVNVPGAQTVHASHVSDVVDVPARLKNPVAHADTRLVDASAHVYVASAAALSTAVHSAHTVSASAVPDACWYMPSGHVDHIVQVSAVLLSCPTVLK